MKPWKRMTRLLLLAAVLLLALSVWALADDPIASGDINENIHWSIGRDSVLTISGTGAMPDYINGGAPWYSYRSQITGLVVEEGITGIGNYAFYQQEKITTASLPDTLETLGWYCFYQCNALESISIPEGVEILPDAAFWQCRNLQTVSLPESLKTIGAYAFYCCDSLEAIDLPDGVTSLGGNAFYECSKLTEITIPAGVTNLTAMDLFGACYSLSSISLPGTLEKLGGRWTFSGTSIRNIYFEGTLEQWLSVVFDGASLPMQQSCNLYINGEKQSNLIIPDGTTQIPAYAFQNVNLNTVLLPDSVNYVGLNAFSGCTQLQKVYYLGDQSSWNSIAWNTGNDPLIDAPRVFVSSAADLHAVTVVQPEHGSVSVSTACCVAGETVTVTVQPDPGYTLDRILVNEEALEGTSFTAQADTDYTVSAEFAFYMNEVDHGTCGDDLTWCLYENGELVISGTGAMNSSPWRNNHQDMIQSVIVSDGVTFITSSAFDNCAALKTVELPVGLTYIGPYAFRNCDSLESIVLPDGLETIGNYAFYNCDSLASIIFPDGLETIDYYAFYDCSSLKAVLLPGSLSSVGRYAFDGCYQIQKVYYTGDQEQWNSISWGNSNYPLINAPRVYVSSAADLHTVTVAQAENGTVSVCPWCVAGETVTLTVLPDPGYRCSGILVNGEPIEGTCFVAENTDYSVTAEFAFYMNAVDHGTCGDDLTWCLYENGELFISGTGAMYENTSWNYYRDTIRYVVINEGVTSISRSAFQSCTALKTVELPVSLRSTGHNAFSSCSMESVSYAGSIYDWLGISFNTYYEYGGWDTPQSVEKLYINGELIEDLVIPADVTSIPRYAFCGFQGLRSVSFTEGLESIGEYAFCNCTGLDSVLLPESVKTIGNEAFYNCHLTFAEFQGDAPSVGSYAFDDAANFTIYYHSGKTGWNSPTWNSYTAACVDELSDYSILDAENKNGQGIQFRLNTTAKTATVGSGSSSNNNSGYYGSQRGAVIIPDVVTKDGTVYSVIGVGANAFSGNKRVVTVSIGKNVTSVIPSAFRGCPNLLAFTVSEENQYYAARDGALYDVSGLYLYVYPGGKANASFTVPETVMTVGQYAFCDNRHLKSLTVGRNVTAIYRQAFCGLENLEEITLPFIGTREKTPEENDYYYYSEVFWSVFDSGYYYRNPLESGRDWDHVTQQEVFYTGNLKRVTITGGDLDQQAFSDCTTIEEISLAFIPNVIPRSCFSGCTSLQKLTFGEQECEMGALMLPEGVETIENNAFNGCLGIISVTLPATLTYIDSSAFSGSGLERFAVAEGNTSYSTDQWGVLYNYDKTALVQYPSCRAWPYYNVMDTTTSIGNQAFSGCQNLVNLYIPNSVTSINSGAIDNCPDMTLCCYRNSTAARYALNHGLTAWYMDNKELQGIEIISLPEQTVQVQGQVDLQGLYVVGDYDGKKLQIDDYSVSYDQRTSGVKTVTVEYQGKSVTFEMVFYTSDQGNIIQFHSDEELEGKMVLIAVYDSNGRMLYTGNATIAQGSVQIGVSEQVYQNADYAKLFILNEDTFAPVAEVQQEQVG